MSHNVHFVVVDFETTGIGKWGNDRIVEVAALRLDSDGNILEEFVTLINPRRDVGPTSKHGITASDVAEAPTFDVVSGDVFHTVRDAVFVAHNVHFDMRFLRLEACRLGINLPEFPYLCTMQLAGRIDPNLPGRSLETVCSHLGIILERAHSAEADARATAQVLRMGLQMFSDARGPDLEKLGVFGESRSVLDWPKLPRKRRTLRRGNSGKHLRERQHMIDRLIARLPASSKDDTRADEYLIMLDAVLEDRKITTDEIDVLCSVASQIGLSQEQIRLLHERYLQDLVSLALGDGIISEFESSDLKNVQTLLGISSTRYEELRKLSFRDHSTGITARQERYDMIGCSVCFTGDLQLKIDGHAISKTDAGLIAKNKGLVVKNNVTKELDFLVAADPETQSNKGTLARKYGVRILSEPAFWQRLGVDGSSNATDGSHNRERSARESSVSVRTPLHSRMENGAKPLAGKTLVVTGTLEGYSRAQIEALIKECGGKAAKSVSKKTDYLVAGEKAGSKLAKAESLGVTVLSEREFLDLIGKE